MLELIERLFDVARCPPANIKIHRERHTENCFEIQSIGILVRTVKIEFVSFIFQSKTRYMGIVHTDSGSAIFCCDDEIRAEDMSVGTALTSLIERELSAIVVAAEDMVFEAIATELMQANAIRLVSTRLTESVADDFVTTTTAGEYTSAEQFLTDALKVKHEH